MNTVKIESLKDIMEYISKNWRYIKEEELLDLVDHSHSLGYIEYEESEKTTSSDDEKFNEGREEGYNEGFEEGIEEGRKEGRDNGYDEGIEEGRKEGIKEGHDKGYDEGHEDGYEQGKHEV